MKPSAKPKIHQLSNMEIHEVSLVDHAANKRRFLIAKRSDELAQNEDADSAPIPEQPPATEPPAQTTQTTTDPASETNALLRELLVAVKDGSRTATTTAANEDQQPTQVTHKGDESGAVEKALQQRLARLEKYFGLPNSEAPEGPPRRRTGHSWPFDINRPGSPEDDGAGRGGE